MAYHIGLDIVNIERFRRLSGDTAFLSRVFTPNELYYAESKKAPYKHLAGRFALKEAFLKALGTGMAEGISWQDIEVRREPGRGPVVEFKGDLNRYGSGITAIKASLAYTGTAALASVVLA